MANLKLQKKTGQIVQFLGIGISNFKIGQSTKEDTRLFKNIFGKMARNQSIMINESLLISKI